METSVRERIATLRSASALEIDASRRSVELAAAAAFGRALPLLLSRVEATSKDRENLLKIKEHLHHLEKDLGEALLEKANKKEKHCTVRDCISTRKARIEELEKIVQDQKTRKNEYASIITQQSSVLEALDEKCNRDDTERKNIKEAIAWYHKFLGFRAVGGDGVKFYFNKIDWKHPDAEFSLTVRLDGDKYILLQCDPFLKDTSRLIEELNHTNGLFQFVRIMRGKFLESISNECFLAKKDVGLDTFTAAISSPPPVSVDSRLESVTGEFDADAEQPRRVQSSRLSEKDHFGHSHVKSPVPAISLPQSPRFRITRSSFFDKIQGSVEKTVFIL